MRLYKLYVYEFFDESIGENNSYFQCLTKRFGTENETPDCWLGHISELEISKILKYCWWKEDVDIFVKENPECKGLHFTIYREERIVGEKNWETYCPLQTKRDNLINELL